MSWQWLKTASTNAYRAAGDPLPHNLRISDSLEAPTAAQIGPFTRRRKLFMRSLKEECLERMVFFGERSLHAAVVAFPAYYHAERNHQALGNRLIDPGEEVGCATGEVVCRERLGGILRYYYRKAA